MKMFDCREKTPVYEYKDEGELIGFTYGDKYRAFNFGQYQVTISKRMGLETRYLEDYV